MLYYIHLLCPFLLEGCLIGGGARGRGMAWGGAVLGLVATKFPVHKTTHYYMHTF